MKLQMGRLSFIQQRWIFFLALVVALYLIVRVTQAQDGVLTPELTDVPTDSAFATLVPTVELMLEVDSPTATPAPPLSIEIPVTQTEIPIVMLVPTDEATLEVTAEADVITELTPTPVMPEATLLPTDEVDVTAVPTDEAGVTAVPTELDPAAEATDAVEAITLTPVMEAEATLMPETTLMPEATEVLTETVIPATDIPVDPFHISGQIDSNLPLRQAALIIREAVTNQVVAVQDNGTFSADLPPGEYQFIFTALYCLPRVIPVTITDKPMRLPTVSLIGGDLDQNGAINMADAMLVAQNFGSAVSPGAIPVDLNGDGVVNIYDLVLVSASIQ